MSSSTDHGALGRSRRCAGRVLRAACAVAAFAGVLSLGGCNIVGGAALLVGGPEKTPAVYELPEKTKTVVFIDDRASVVSNRATRQRIATTTEATMLEGGAVTGDLVASESILRITASERFGKPRGIAEVGRDVGADTVIYATVDQFSLTQDGTSLSPLAVLRVKVIKAADSTRLFPAAPQEWFTLEVKMPARPTGVAKSAGEQARMEQELADETGKRLGRLFFKHVKNEPTRVGS